MNSIYKIIDEELSKSKSSFENINSSSVSGMARKINEFSKEIQRLNIVIPEHANSFIKSNNLSDFEVQIIKDHINSSVTDFIKNSGIAGINPNYKLDI